MRIRAITRSCLIVIIAFIPLFVGRSEDEETSTLHEGVSLIDWIGNYEFYEYYLPNINMEYSIYIYQNGNEYLADINIEGFQTNQKIRADVIGNSESIDLVFKIYISESTGVKLNDGEILLSLKKEDSEIYTYWGVVRPILPENMDSGEVYITKE